MGDRKKGRLLRKGGTTIAFLALLIISSLIPLSQPNFIPKVRAEVIDDSVGSVAPVRYWGPFSGTRGDVQININRTGIAVRVEVPREFLEGVIANENDTRFIQSDIRNDYYYYAVWDEARHWSYDWNRTESDAPCFKPNFSLHDANAPWCVEIWNNINGTFLTFTPPKFVRFVDLNAPTIAGVYNFTLYVANKTNRFGYPDFVHAWNTTLFVPVSMVDNPASISGFICDNDDPSLVCPPIIGAKGIVYATNVDQNSPWAGRVARAYVNQTTGRFNLTGLAPGSYEIRGAAGVVNGIAYSVSNPTSPQPVQRGSTVGLVQVRLLRAPQVCGEIKYRNSTDPVQTNFLPHSLTDHPFLAKIGFRVLNITVEATDQSGHTFRALLTSKNSSSDTFRIITGNGTKYVGNGPLGTVDPYGTEFAGLPDTGGTFYTMQVNVYITGYLQQFGETVTIASMPNHAIPIPCTNVSPNPIVMRSGGVITGTIEFHRNALTLETPHDAELALGVSSTATDALFGGNILIQAYNQAGQLKGVVVINGTYPDGRTIYANSVSLRFYIVGFSEFYNRTWAGTWVSKDSGLPQDEYTISVNIRGYEQDEATIGPYSLPLGSNRTVAIRMTRAGAFEIGVFSYNNRFGSRAIQAPQPFRFLNLSIPVRARVYFYDSAGRIVGYVERLLIQGVNGVSLTFFRVLFAGQNWSLRDIWFFGSTPTHLATGSYSIKGYTLGYVQQRDVLSFVQLVSLTITSVALLIGNELDITSPIFAEPNLFWHIPEHDHAIGEAYGGGGLAGALPMNTTAFNPTPIFPIFGFGAALNVSCTSALSCNSSFTGLGHFFYVAPDGTRYFDYGLDTDTYQAQVPEFGFNKHFITIIPYFTVDFPDLSLGEDVFMDLFSMARVRHDTVVSSLVTGWVAGITVTPVVPLTWVTVEATNGTTTRSTPTLDGRYDGAGALFLPAGIYTITFSVANYQPQSFANFQVAWNSSYVAIPPLGPLCPLADPGLCGSSPAPPNPAGALTGLITVPLIAVPLSIGEKNAPAKRRLELAEDS